MCTDFCKSTLYWFKTWETDFSYEIQIKYARIGFGMFCKHRNEVLVKNGQLLRYCRTALFTEGVNELMVHTLWRLYCLAAFLWKLEFVYMYSWRYISESFPSVITMQKIYLWLPDWTMKPPDILFYICTYFLKRLQEWFTLSKSAKTPSVLQRVEQTSGNAQ